MPQQAENCDLFQLNRVRADVLRVGQGHPFDTTMCGAIPMLYMTLRRARLDVRYCRVRYLCSVVTTEAGVRRSDTRGRSVKAKRDLRLLSQEHASVA